MRLLKRDLKTIYYANYTSHTEYVDEYGNSTGDLNITYGTPTQIKVYISSLKGDNQYSAVGIEDNYTATMIAEGDCAIEDSAVLWVGTATTNPCNYVVLSRSKTANFTKYVIKKVKKSL